MLKILKAEDGKLHSDLDATYGPNNDMNKSIRGGIIDYIFYKNNGKKTLSTIRKIPKIQYQWHKNHKDLADHNPVEMIITYMVKSSAVCRPLPFFATQKNNHGLQTVLHALNI